MRFGVNVPNFGPGTDPGMLRDWARTAEGLGLDLLMLSDHVVVTPDVAEQYPEPFYEPFTTLSWLAGVTERIRLGTTVVVLPYRHPLLVARMTAGLHRLSGGRFILGVGVGWARQEFAALGVPYERRGRLTEEYLRTVRAALAERPDTGPVPVWVGGNSDAALHRAVRLGDAWHPLRLSIDDLEEAARRLRDAAHGLGRPVPALAPRIALRLTDKPINTPDRPAGEGTPAQVAGDLDRLRRLGADTVVFDPFTGDPQETAHPHRAWRDLAAVAADIALGSRPDRSERE